MVCNLRTGMAGIVFFMTTVLTLWLLAMLSGCTTVEKPVLVVPPVPVEQPVEDAPVTSVQKADCLILRDARINLAKKLTDKNDAQAALEVLVATDGAYRKCEALGAYQ